MRNTRGKYLAKSRQEGYFCLTEHSLFVVLLLLLKLISVQECDWANAEETAKKTAPPSVSKTKANNATLATEKIELGEMLFFNGNPKAAIKAFDDAIALDHNLYQAHFDLACLYQQMGNLPGAINEYREIARLHNKERDVFLTLGMLFREQGDLNEAIANFKVALSLPAKVQETDTENVLAFTLISNQNPTEALIHFDHLIETGAKDKRADWTLGKAMALSKLNKTAESLSEIDRALAMRSSYPAAHNLKGDVLYASDHKEEATKEYEKAIDEDPLFSQGYLSLGNLYLKEKQFTLARDIFKKGEKVKPDEKNILYGLAYALENCGDMKAAIQKYQNVLAMENNSAEREIIQAHLKELTGL